MTTGSSPRPSAGGSGVLAGLLRGLRERALLTQEQLAARAGVSIGTVRGLETGRVRRPRGSSLQLLADALALTGREREALVAAARGDQAGPPRPGGGPPCLLPPDVADFTGRSRHLRQLDALLAAPDGGRASAVVISAIAGTAGVGKTALAIHWAHRVRDRFPDGQLYVNLRGYAAGAPLRPIQALTGFLRALGVAAEQVPVELEQAAGLYRSLLADKHVLVVLDNAASPAQVRPLLPGSGGCLVLVTSRDRLAGLVARDGARRLSLEVLEASEAVALLARILGRERVVAEPQAAAELARVCGYLPLALRIAAANLTDQPHRSLAGYLAELQAGDRLAALQVDGDEQAAVRAAFDLSYRRLAPETQRLFRLLGLVPGPDVTAAAAAALAETTLEEAGRLLARLAGVHLLAEHARGRYGFHDLLRAYAADRAHDEDAAAGREAALGRLLEWYLHSADGAARLLYPEKLRLPLPQAATGLPVAAFHDHAGAVAWLDAERANLVAVVQHAADQGPRPAAWLLADTLRGYFGLRVHAVDWLAVAEAGLAAAQADGDLRGQAAAHLSLTDALRCQDRCPQAIAHGTRAVALARRSGWLEGQATTLGSLGSVYWELGRLQEAADHYRQALAIDRQTGWRAGESVRLTNLSVVYRELGRLQEAADHYTEALAIDRELGARGGEAVDLGNLGETYHLLGRFGEALDHLARALALHREVGNREFEADTLRVLAEVHRDVGDHSRALALAHDAVVLARHLGHVRNEADALNTLATVHQGLARHTQAIDHHTQALRLARDTGTSHPELVALLGLAAAQGALGQLDQARACADQALALARRAGYRLLEGQALTNLAAVELRSGQPERAADHARQALAIQRGSGHRLGQARALVTLGHALRITDGAGAAACWREAHALLADIGSPDADQVGALLRQAGGTAPPRAAPSGRGHGTAVPPRS
jgi:tetratricopeptide (TPR) repeat protein/transcriptional regulator with XRE-family HTH domain